MNELSLIFSRDDNALTYRLTTPWGDDLGEAQPFVPFMSSDDDDEDLRWYLEEYMELPIGGALVRAKRIEQSLAAWGRKLFGAVFDQEEHRELFHALVDGEAPRPRSPPAPPRSPHPPKRGQSGRPGSSRRAREALGTAGEALSGAREGLDPAPEALRTRDEVLVLAAEDEF